VDDHVDDELARELRDAADLFDPLPPYLTAAAIAAFTWRDIDAELAELVFDSLEATTVTIRGTDRPRMLTFEGTRLVIEVEIDGDGAFRRITGRMTPPAAAEVSIRHEQEETTVAADDLGRFAAGGITAGRIRLRVSTADAGRPVVTDWFAD
jgi:hypothetical protein